MRLSFVLSNIFSGYILLPQSLSLSLIHVFLPPSFALALSIICCLYVTQRSSSTPSIFLSVYILLPPFLYFWFLFRSIHPYFCPHLAPSIFCSHYLTLCLSTSTYFSIASPRLAPSISHAHPSIFCSMSCFLYPLFRSSFPAAAALCGQKMELMSWR